RPSPGAGSFVPDPCSPRTGTPPIFLHERPGIGTHRIKYLVSFFYSKFLHEFLLRIAARLEIDMHAMLHHGLTRLFADAGQSVETDTAKERGKMFHRIRTGQNQPV